MKKILLGLGIIVVLVLILFLVSPDKNTPPVDLVINEKPTDFAVIGTFVMDSPTTEGAPFPKIVYEKPGAPALTKTLIFDPLSFCQAENGSTACIAMSTTYDIPFGGKRVLIEGINQKNETVLVRKMGILRAETPQFEPLIGRIFISWEQAREFINTCKVASLFQNHSLDITLNLKDGHKFQTVEPVIDEVFKITNDLGTKCGQIQMATE